MWAESCDCGACGKTLVLIGEDVTEQLDVEPAKFFVHRHIRTQYACRTGDTITAAPIPPPISANLKTVQCDPAGKAAFEAASGVHLPTCFIGISTGAGS